MGLDSIGGASHGVSSLGLSGVQGMGTNLGLLVNGGSSGIGGGGGGIGPHDLASALGAPPFVPSNSVNYGMRYKRSDISSGTSSHWRH